MGIVSRFFLQLQNFSVSTNQASMSMTHNPRQSNQSVLQKQQRWKAKVAVETGSTDRLEGDQHSSFILLHESPLTAALIRQDADHTSDPRVCCFQGDEGLVYP